MAQLVARLVRIEKVRGSNPLSSTEEIPRMTCANARIALGIRRFALRLSFPWPPDLEASHGRRSCVDPVSTFSLLCTGPVDR